MNIEEAKEKIKNCDTSWYCQEAFDTLLKEIERLNNIINELEKELEERYLDFKDSECEEVRTTAYEDISILKRIKELKGVGKE